MPKILESEALALAQNIDTLSDAEKPLALDILKRYQEQQWDNGEPEWPTQARSQEEGDARFRSMFEDLKNVDKAAPSLADAIQYSDNPDADRARVASIAYLSRVYGKPADEIGSSLDLYRNDYTTRRGQKGTDDLGFYKLAAAEVAAMKRKEDTALEGAKAALRGEDVIASLQAWQAKNLDRIPDSTEFTKGYLKAKEGAGDYLPIADELLKLMESGTGKSTRPFDSAAANRLDEIAGELATMKPRERKEVYASIAARVEAAGYDQKGFWSQMLGQIDQGLFRMSQTVPQGMGSVLGTIGEFVGGEDTVYDREFRDRLAKERGEETTAEMKLRQEKLGEVQSEVAQIISGTVDPVRPTLGWLNDTVETGLIKGPGAVLPFMTASAALGPYGAGLVFTADFAEQNRRDLVASGLDRDDAARIGMMAAPLQAAVESLSNAFQLGRFTKLQTVLAGFTKPIGGGAGLAVRYAQNAGISLATEFTEEQLQDNFIVPAVQEIVGALTEDVPEVDWSFFKTRAAESTPELLSVLAPMALVFGGVMTNAQANLSRDMTGNIDALKALNYSEAQAVEVVSEKTEDARIAKARSLWASRAGDKVTLESGAKNLAERMRQLSGDAMAQQRELERRGKLPILRPMADGKWLMTIPSDGSAATFDSHQEADKARWTWTEDQLGKVHALTRETLASMEKNLNVGREVAVEFFPDIRTAQDAVNEGASVEQIKNRVEQGKALGDISPDTSFEDAQAIDKATTEADGFLSSLRILGSSKNEFKDGILRTTIKLWEGSNILTLVEEKLEGDAKALIMEPKGREWMLSRLRSYEQASGDKLFRELPDEQLKNEDLVEAWSHLGQSYLVGRSTFGEPLQKKAMRRFGRLLMRSGLTGAMNAESSFFAAVASRAQKLGELKQAGKLSGDLVSELEKQLGIDSQVSHDAAAAKEADAIASEAVDTSGYSPENPGPNGETFSISSKELRVKIEVSPDSTTLGNLGITEGFHANHGGEVVPDFAPRASKQGRKGQYVGFYLGPAINEVSQYGQNVSTFPLNPNTPVKVLRRPGQVERITPEMAAAWRAEGFSVVVGPAIIPSKIEIATLSANVLNTPGPNGETFSVREMDAEYMAAVESGDVAKQQAMVDEAAKAAGYLPHADFRDAHRAPSGPAGADEEVRNGDADASLVQVARGVHNQPDNYFDPRVGPRYYSYQDKAGMEAFKAIRAAMDKIQRGKKAMVTVFRAVPIDIKGARLENRDWVTPSKTYAIDHGESRFGEDEYRIVEEAIPAENLFWDGNDIREWGKDDSQSYFYKNTANNIKSADPVTRDESGKIVPLSQRFNPADNRITFSIRPGDFSARMEAKFSLFQAKPELRLAIAQVAKERVLQQSVKINEAIAKQDAATRALQEAETAFAEEMASLRADYEADEKAIRDERDTELKGVAADKGTELDRERIRRDADKKLARVRLEYERNQKEIEAKKAANDAKLNKSETAADREALKAIVRALDGALAVVPPVVRASVGGYFQAAKITTSAGMLKWAETRIDKLNVELEKYLKKEYRQQIAKLFKRYAPKKDDKGRITSNITADAAEDIGFAFDFASLDDANQEKEMAALEKTLEESEDSTEIQDAIGKIAIVQLFYKLEERESSELEAAAMWLKDVGGGAREARKIIDAARAEAVKEAKNEAKKDASNGKLSSLPDAENVEADVRSSTFKRFTNDVKGFLNSALFTLGQQLEIVFGQDSRITTEFHRRAVRAANDSTDIKRDIEARRLAFVEKLFGTTSRIKQAGRMGALTVPTASGVMIEAGGKTTTIEVPAEIVLRIIEGTADLKALGFTSKEASTLADAWADNEALPVKRQKRVFKIERRSDGKKTELTMSQDEAIQYFLWSNQKASREQMEHDGWSKESFQQLNAFLSDDAKALAGFFADEYARLGRLIEPVYRRMFHAPFPRVTNYSPIFRDISSADSIIDIDQQGHGSGVSSGFILARNKNARSALRRTSAISAFMQHAQSAAHWIAHVELVRDLRSVLIDKEVQNAIRSNGRTAAANGIKKRVMQLENQGKVGAAGIAELDSWGSRLLQARAFKGLAWRISPVMKQASAYFNPLLADVPAWDYMRGTARLLSGQLDVSAMWNSPDIQRRIEMGFSAESRIAMDKLGYTGSTLLAAMGKGMLPMTLMDAGWTTAGAAIAFDYYRRNNVKSGMNEAQAESAALDQLEMMIAQSAQPADAVNRSLIEGIQNPWLKSMWMFASESRKTLAIEIMALRRLATGKSKNKALDVQRAVVAHVVMATTTQLMAGVLSLLMGDDDDREREWSVEEWAAAIAAGPINGLFLFGDAVDYVGRRLFGLHAFEPSTAIGQAVKTVSNAPGNLDKVINGEPEEQRKAFLRLGEAVGQAASLVGPGNPFTATDVILGNPLKDAEKILTRLTD